MDRRRPRAERKWLEKIQWDIEAIMERRLNQWETYVVPWLKKNYTDEQIAQLYKEIGEMRDNET